jgi:hypothetical protein
VSAPPLPEIFGNYALGEFVEVAAPPPVDWLPQTAGWGWLGALLLAVALHRGARRLRHWYRNRYRGEASALLGELSGSPDSQHLVIEVNRLLKLTALAAYPREQVARLSGEAWVAFLNGQCAEPPFDARQARLLAVGVYGAVAPDAESASQLIAASLAWVRDHRGVSDG